MSSADGQGSAGFAEALIEEHRGHIAAGTQRDSLEKLLAEAESAVAGAEAKVDKQRVHLKEAESSVKQLRAVLVKIRKAADKAE